MKTNLINEKRYEKGQSLIVSFLNGGRTVDGHATDNGRTSDGHVTDIGRTCDGHVTNMNRTSIEHESNIDRTCAFPVDNEKQYQKGQTPMVSFRVKYGSNTGEIRVNYGFARQFVYRVAAMLLMLVTMSVGQVWGDNAGFWTENAAAIKYYAGTDVEYVHNATGVSSRNLGTVTDFYLKGWWFKMWRNSGGNVCADASLFYRVYRTNESAPAFLELSEHTTNWDVICHYKDGLNINLLSGLDGGTYYFEYYFKGFGKWNSSSGCDEQYLSNGGGNYKIQFEYKKTESSLVAITEDYEFSPSVEMQSGGLYEERKFLSIGGSGYKKGLQIKNGRQIAFKVNAGATVTVTYGASDGRSMTMGTSYNKDGYASGGITSTNGTLVHTFSEASTVYLAASNDLYLTRLQVSYSAPTTYTLTYSVPDKTAGSVPAAVGSLASGANVTLDAATGFSRTGYTFNKWYDGSANYAAGVAFTMPANDVTMTATWTAKQTTVTFDKNGGRNGQGECYIHYGDNSKPAGWEAPTRSGYTFDGYYTTADGGTKYFNADGSAAKAWDIEDATKTLYAHWTEDAPSGECEEFKADGGVSACSYTGTIFNFSHSNAPATSGKSQASANDGSGKTFTKAFLPGGTTGSSNYYTLTTKAAVESITVYYIATDSKFTTDNQSKAGNLMYQIGSAAEVTSSTTGNKSNTVAYAEVIAPAGGIASGTTVKIYSSSNRLAIFAVEVCPQAECNKTEATLTWTTVPADGIVGDADITLTVNKGSSTGAVTYTSSNTSVATVVDGVLHYVAAGTTTITANLAGDATYCPKSIEQSITVSAVPTYTVTVNDPETTCDKNVSAKEGQTVTITNDCAVAGRHLTGYTSSPEVGGTFNSGTKTYTFTMPAYDVTLTAVWVDDVYYLKHPFDGGSTYKWSDALTSNGDGTYSIEANYGGDSYGCNWNTAKESTGQKWIEGANCVKVGAPVAGDLCIFTLNPTANSGNGSITITKVPTAYYVYLGESLTLPIGHTYVAGEATPAKYASQLTPSVSTLTYDNANTLVSNVYTANTLGQYIVRVDDARDIAIYVYRYYAKHPWGSCEDPKNETYNKSWVWRAMDREGGVTGAYGSVLEIDANTGANLAWDYAYDWNGVYQLDGSSSGTMQPTGVWADGATATTSGGSIWKEMATSGTCNETMISITYDDVPEYSTIVPSLLPANLNMVVSGITPRTITFGAEPAEGGSVSTDWGSTSPLKVEAGADVTLSAKAAVGYQFTGWYANQECTGDKLGSDVNLTFENVTTHKTAYAKFEAEVQSITLHAAGDVNELGVGQTLQLTVEYSPVGATIGNSIASWTVDNSNYLGVSSTGLVTAKAVGSGHYVTATTTNGKTATYYIDVISGACDQWSVHMWNTGGTHTRACLTEYDHYNNEWRSGQVVLPSNSDDEKLKVLYNGNAQTHSAEWTTRWLPMINHGGGQYYPGQDAVGYFRIYSNSTSENYYLGFQPTYVVTYGSGDFNSATWQQHDFARIQDHEFHTDVVKVPNDFDSKNIFVGTKRAGEGNPYVAKHDGLETDKSNKVAMSTITPDKGGKYGYYKIFENSIDRNWYVSFVSAYAYELRNEDESIIYAGTSETTSATTIYNGEGSVVLPTKAGYTLTGWTRSVGGDKVLDLGAAYTFYTSLDILYPVWTPIVYTISYEKNGGEWVGDYVAPTSYSAAANTELANGSQIVKTGYSFRGWFENETFTVPSKRVLTLGTDYYTNHIGDYGDKTMYAKWEVQSYTITYKDQGDADFSGTWETTQPTTHTYGTATTLVKPTKASSLFLGWYETPDCLGAPITTIGATAITANKTLYAKWADYCFGMVVKNPASTSKPVDLSKDLTTLTGGSVSENGLDENTKEKGLKFGHNADYIKVDLTGDKQLGKNTRLFVSFVVDSDNENGITFGTESTHPKTVDGSNSILTDAKGTYLLEEFVVTKESPLYEATIFYIYRAGGNGTYIKELYVADCQTICNDPAPRIVEVSRTTDCSPNYVVKAVDQRGNNLNTGSFQWYKDEVAIQDATSRSYTITEDGSYTVEYTNTCPVFSSNSFEVENLKPSVQKLVPFQYYHVDSTYAAGDARHLFTYNSATYQVSAIKNVDTAYDIPSGAVYSKVGTDGVDTLMLNRTLLNNLAVGDSLTISATPKDECDHTYSENAASVKVYAISKTTKTLAFILPGANSPTKYKKFFVLDGDFLTGYNKADLYLQNDETNNDNQKAGVLCYDPDTELPLYTDLKANFLVTPVNGYAKFNIFNYEPFDLLFLTDFVKTDGSNDAAAAKKHVEDLGLLVDYRPMFSTKAHMSGFNNWKDKGFTANPVAPKQPQLHMNIVCYAHPMFEDMIPDGDGFYYDALDPNETVFQMLSQGGYDSNKGIQGFEMTGANEFIKIALTHYDAHGDVHDNQIAPVPGANDRTLIASCERQENINARFMILSLNADATCFLTARGREVIIRSLKYLLETRPTKVTDCHFDFVNEGGVGFNQDTYETAGGTGYPGDGKWSTAANWAPRHSVLPTKNVDVRISANCRVDTTSAVAANVKVKDGYVLTIADNAALQIQGIAQHVSNEGVLSPTSPSDLVLSGSASGTGAFIHGDKVGQTGATVQMYSIAHTTGTGDPSPAWQWFATPFSDVYDAQYNYYGAWVYKFDNTNHTWNPDIRNGDAMEPFSGYSITHTEANHLYHMEGTLATTDNQNVTLYSGLNLVGNSWTAPINISALKVEDFGGAEATVVLFNTGLDVNGNGTVNNAADGNVTTAGTYVAIPVNTAEAIAEASAKVPVIPAMQAFEVKASAGTTLTLDYDRLVRTNTVNIQPMRTPSRATQEDAPMPNNINERLRVYVQGSRYGDYVYLFQHDDATMDFDNGWDGRKYMPDNNDIPTLVVRPMSTAWQVSTQPQFAGTTLGFYQGEDNIYTLGFDYIGYETLWLYDTTTGQYTKIRTGNTYVFTSNESRTRMQKRFKIVDYNPNGTDEPGVTTGVDDVSPTDSGPRKILLDDKLYILRDGHMYDAVGRFIY